MVLFVSRSNYCYSDLGSSINRLVTDGNTKLCCQGFVLALFQSTTAYQIGSEHTQDYTKLFLVCKVEILQVTVNKIEVYHLFRLIYRRFSAISAENSLKGYLCFLLMFIQKDKLSINNNTVLKIVY